MFKHVLNNDDALRQWTMYGNVNEIKSELKNVQQTKSAAIGMLEVMLFCTYDMCSAYQRNIGCARHNDRGRKWERRREGESTATKN